VNGFLAALVARTEGRLPVLERRPLSLFEPLARSAPVTPLVHPEQQHDDPRGAPSPPPAMPPAARSDVRDPPVADRSSHSAPTARRSGVLAPEPVAVTGRHAAPGLHEERPAAGRPAAVPHAPGAKVAARDARVAMPGVEAPPVVHPRGGREHAEGAGARALAPAPDRAATLAGAPQQGPAPRTQPSVSLARAQAMNAARREPAPIAAPTPAPVHISIGRVEIRAVQASADKPRAIGPAAPRLSLDDYLQRRNGAAR
jgi:hypothetical protein